MTSHLCWCSKYLSDAQQLLAAKPLKHDRIKSEVGGCARATELMPSIVRDREDAFCTAPTRAKLRRAGVETSDMAAQAPG